MRYVIVFLVLTIFSCQPTNQAPEPIQECLKSSGDEVLLQSYRLQKPFARLHRYLPEHKIWDSQHKVTWVDETESKSFYFRGRLEYGRNCSEEDEAKWSLVCTDSFDSFIIHHNMDTGKETLPVDSLFLERMLLPTMENKRMKIEDAKIKYKYLKTINGRKFAVVGLQGKGVKKDSKGKIIGSFKEPYKRLLAVTNVQNTLIYLDFENTKRNVLYPSPKMEYIRTRVIQPMVNKRERIQLPLTLDFFSNKIELLDLMLIEDL